MKIEKKVLNEALKVLGKVVCQTSPVELYQMIRFVGNADGIKAMATRSIIIVSLIPTDEIKFFIMTSKTVRKMRNAFPSVLLAAPGVSRYLNIPGSDYTSV